MLINGYIDQPLQVVANGALSTQGRNLLAGNGAAAQPSYSFISEPGSGWYWIAAGNVALALSGTKNVDCAPTLYQFTNASGASNSVLRIENTDNTGATSSNAILEAKTGGVTQTGSPQMRWTVPSGTSWYAGPDRSRNDTFEIGTGATMGSARFFQLDNRLTTATLSLMNLYIDALTITIASAAGATYGGFRMNTQTINWTGNTGITSLNSVFELDSWILTSNTAGTVATKATTMQVSSNIAGVNVTITDNSAIRILNSAQTGVSTNQEGIFIEALTGGTNNYGIWIATPTGTVAESIHTTGGILNSQGPVQIGGAANTTANQFNNGTQGAATTTMFIGNASITVVSDMRIKQNIVVYAGDALQLLRGLRVVEYDMREEHKPFGGVYQGRYVGLTAQNLYQVAPWVVNTQGGKDCRACLTGRACDQHLPWAVKQELLSGLFVKGLQEADTRLGALETENMALKERLAAAGL